MDLRYVLVLQHIAPETPGLILPALDAKKLAVRYAKPFAGDKVPSELADAAGLVVMGGPMGVYEADRYPYLRDEIQLIEQALASNCPVLGVCLGSQMLAHALGAKVAPGQQKEIGWHRVTLTQDALLDPLFKGLESSFLAMHWHGDVFDLPPGSTLLASSELTAHQAFRHGTSAYGLLFHMEVTETIIEGLVATFPDELAQVGSSPARIFGGAREHLPSLAERASRVFTGFADLCAARRDAK
ncbi:MAG TPA: gamma-glutamyl-gamma-aminobutyrate hydrolase family protein [Polyangiaceae bacterium]|nr:gamma-glutamyl-gamma-aminobutyrate hydrolase family protein [Polyangiaceae bacterium]